MNIHEANAKHLAAIKEANAREAANDRCAFAGLCVAILLIVTLFIVKACPDSGVAIGCSLAFLWASLGYAFFCVYSYNK